MRQICIYKHRRPTVVRPSVVQTVVRPSSSSVFCPRRFVLRRSSPSFRRPSSVGRRPSPVVRRPSSVVRRRLRKGKYSKHIGCESKYVFFSRCSFGRRPCKGTIQDQKSPNISKKWTTIVHTSETILDVFEKCQKYLFNHVPIQSQIQRIRIRYSK